MYISLNGNDWTLQGYLPSSHRFIAESGINFKINPLIPELPAKVPGSVHADLFRAGLIDEPYYALNSLKCEWVENKCWLYQRTFIIDKEQVNKKLRLVFEGINYESRFYLNGELLGVHKNMFTPATFDITGKVTEGENLIEVLCEILPEDEAQMGFTSKCKEQTARFFYTWDFCTRLASVGIWKNVGLYVYDDCQIREVCLISDYKEDKGIIDLNIQIDCEAKAHFEITLSFEDDMIEKKIIDVVNKEAITNFEVEDPMLWWPNGYGNQNLYTVKISLITENGIQDSRTMKTGIRSLTYVQNEGSPEDAIPYTVVINGKKIYLKGMNFLPIDHLVGEIDGQRYCYNVELMKRQNVNLVRIWGGSYFEKEIFYDLCDEMGLLVWQEFMQSNSGMDGVPSVIEEFLTALKQSSLYALKTLRNHICISIWDGGNELKDGNRNTVSKENPNIKMLSELVKKYDAKRIFHTSCPSGPNFSLDLSEQSRKSRRNHNVHGQWVYLGTEKHYEYYNLADHLYHGEFGSNGCPDEESIQKFIPSENLNGYKDNDLLWNFHGNGWWNSYQRECDIFGKQNMDELGSFCSASQLIQAEGVRYIVEANRRRKFKCSGNNIWQFNEPWPNANCSSLVDYYERPKMAYYFVKNAYENIHVSLKYSKLFYETNECTDFTVFINNSCNETKMDVCAEIMDQSGHVIFSSSENITVNENSAKQLFTISEAVDNRFGKIFFVRLTAKVEGKEISRNSYTFGTEPKTPYEGLYDYKDIKLKASRIENTNCIELDNTGKEVAMFISLFHKYYQRCFFSDNYFTLFPGEKQIVEVQGENSQANIVIKDFTRTINIEI